MNRQNANRQIVQILSTLVEMYPDMRFHQLLTNADVLKTYTTPHPEGQTVVEDEYHMESVDLLERMKHSSLMEVQYDRSQRK